MSVIDTKLNLEGGTIAEYGGRYAFVDDNGDQKYMNLYFTEHDKAYRSTDPKAVVLTPTSQWHNELGPAPWQRMVRNGQDKVVLAKEIWEQVKKAEEIEVFNPETNEIVSNKTGDVVDYISRPQTKKAKLSEETLETISEKVSQMSEEEETTTLNMLKAAGIDAAKTVGANQANELITSNLKKALHSIGLSHEFIESEAGHRLMKIIGPLAIHYFADTQSKFINEMVGPNASKNIKEGCKFATQAAMGEVMEPMLMFLVPLLKDLASMGVQSIASAAKGTSEAALLEEDEKEESGVGALLKQQAKEKVKESA